MKKVIVILSLLFLSKFSFSQVAVVEKGGVKIRSSSGALLYDVVPSGGRAIEASLNSEGNRVLVTYNNGRVDVLGKSGTLEYMVQPVDSKAVKAEWSGDKIAITYKCGRVDIVSKSGQLERTIRQCH